LDSLATNHNRHFSIKQRIANSFPLGVYKVSHHLFPLVYCCSVSEGVNLQGLSWFGYDEMKKKTKKNEWVIPQRPFLAKKT